jgi:adenylate cyclase
VTAALILYGWNPIPLRKLELTTIDLRYRLRPDRTPKDVVFVSVDDRSEPAPRRLYARVIDAVDKAAPKAIAVDVTFDSPAEGQQPLEGTTELGQAVANTSAPVAMAALDFTLERGDDGGVHLVPLVLDGTSQLSSECAANGVSYGYAGLPDDPDGRTRRLEGFVPGRAYDDPTMCTFAVIAAHLAGQVGAKQTLTSASRRAWSGQTASTAWIDYPGTIPEVSSADLLDGRAPAESLRGKVVVIGTAVDPQDTLKTPFSATQRGPEVQASAIDTVLRGTPLRDVPRVLDIVLVLALALIPAVAFGLRSWVWRPALIAAAVIALVAIAIVAFLAGYVVSVVVPLIVLALMTVTATLVSALLRARGRPQTAQQWPVTVAAPSSGQSQT